MNELQVRRNLFQCLDSNDDSVVTIEQVHSLPDMDSIIKEEQDYRQLIIKKLRSAQDWDTRDAKAFALG